MPMAASVLCLFALPALLNFALATDCSAIYGVCSGPHYDGPACCLAGSTCVVEGTPAFGIYGDSDIGSYGSASEPASYSRCMPVPGVAITEPEDLDLVTLTLVDALEGLAAGTFTAELLTEAFLARIAIYEPTYNAFTFLNEDALTQARESDAKRASGGAVGPMEGVPIVIKEALNFVGYPSTLGWNYTAPPAGGVGLYPRENAAVVQTLLDAGAIIIGKTNIPAFSLSGTNANSSWAGPTFNAVNTSLAPGGSSAGTATAVAGGFGIWGMAEETGGSIQNPAAAQSLVSIKTTYGVVNTNGLAPLAGSARDVLGPIAKTVRDAAIAYDVISRYGTAYFEGQAPEGGYTALLGHVTLEGKRIGLYGPGWENETISEDVQALYAEAVGQLEALGATVVQDPFAGSGIKELADPLSLAGVEALPYDFQQFVMDFGIPTLSAFADKVGVSPYDEGQPLGDIGERAVFTAGVFNESLMDPDVYPDLSEFVSTRSDYQRIINEVFEKFSLDALVYPHAETLVPELSSEDGIAATTVRQINTAGTPLVTVPSVVPPGMPASPFTLSFLGPAYSEALLLALAYDYEQATQLRIIPKLVTSV